MVAVFDEWGLGYADGMPSSSHKSALQSIVKHEKRFVEWLVRVWSQGQGSQPKLLISEKAWTIPLLNEFEA